MPGSLLPVSKSPSICSHRRCDGKTNNSSSGSGGDIACTRQGEHIGTAVVFWLGAWYICSLLTLFLNKTILTTLHGDEYILGVTQMISTAVYGAAKVYGGRFLVGYTSKRDSGGAVYSTLRRDMVLVGLMRGATVLLGLISLSRVPVSFTETVKSSAPFFTVIFSRIILQQHTSWQVNWSLIPVMAGLALCSFTEISFDAIGFLAAVSNNMVDCVQNVFSKKLLLSLTPVQLQFYTSAAAATLQLPLLLYTLWPQLTGATERMDATLVFWLVIDGVFYHLQSVTAYYTMSLLTPVSQSVANTVKRAILIFLSILYFGNPITLWSASGMGIVVLGVFVYNHCRLRYPPLIVPP